MTDLSATFGKPFGQQVAAFRIRLAQLKATANWKDVWQAEHDRAFMVAGAQKAALLADLAAAVEKAIAKGTTLEEFRKDFAQAVKDHNWHGWTGEETAKGRAWRTRVIYRTNLSTSYAAGRFAQLKEAGFTHWVYLHGNALEPRVQHLAWNGLILPADHPFWQTHYPPNGWGCTCHVAGARSEAGARRRGGDPSVHLADGWDMPLPKTGAPEGIDKGWAYAPGASTADEIAAFVSQKAATLPAQLARDLTAEIATLVGQVLPQSPSTPDEAIALGKKVIADLRAGNTRLAKEWDADEMERAAPAFRQSLHQAISSNEGFGGQAIALAGRTNAGMKSLMSDVGKMMPAAWVRAGNRQPVGVRILQSWERGGYLPKSSAGPAKISTSVSSTAVHEYLHHLQFTVPGLDRLFQELHRRRTVGEVLREIYPGNLQELARKDGYYDPYQGKEYDGFGPLEVLTMALQPLLGSDEKSLIMLGDMMKKDPEMLEFALGMLFYWRL